ncbi:YHS domain-containing protein [Planctomycetota bacterium]
MNGLHKIAILSMLAGFLVAGCGDDGTPPADVGTETADVQLVAGTQTLCPIMGNPISEEVFYDYQGKRIYFCCAGCEDKFKAEPDIFIKQMVDEGITLTQVIEK